MDSFTIDVRPSAEKELRMIPTYIISKITTAINDLAVNPFPLNSVKLTGKEEAYRIRIGDYRVVYVVNVKKKHLIIQRVRHRKGIYKRF